MTEQKDRLIGKTIGRYHIESLLGRGGLAVVYLATDLLWETPVAVKVLPEFFASDEEHAQRFQREASTMANLVHPNIMPVRDFGQAEGVTYFVMDYAGAGTLEDRMGRQFSPEEALEIIRPIVDGVGYAHSQGVVHRDLKPSNVLYNEQDRAMIADFGIAKLMEESGLTRTRESLGTPEYMAPEQSREAALVGPSADIYALGVIIYELLTGQAPYQGATVIDVIEKHKYSPIPSPRTLVPDIPPVFDDFFQRVLAKNPEERTQSADELMDLLELAVAGEALPHDERRRATPSAYVPPSYPHPAAGGGAPPTPLPPSPATVYPSQPPKKNSWLLPVLLGGIVFLAALALIAFLFMRPAGPEKAYTAGLECFRNENWPCCANEFQKVVDEDPAFRDAQERLEECQQRWDLDVAWKELTRCITAEDWQCVQENASRVVELEPADLPARKALAQANFHLAKEILEEDPEAAFALLKSIEQLNLDLPPEGFNSLFEQVETYLQGVRAYRDTDYDKAIAALAPLSSFLDSQKLIYQSHIQLCRQAVKDGKLAKASQEVRKASRLNPDGKEVQACEGAISNNRFAVLLAEGQQHLQDEEWEQAFDVCKQALKIQPEDKTADACMKEAKQALYTQLMARGKALTDQCQLDEAIAAFNQALEYQPDSAEVSESIAKAQDLKKSDYKVIADSWSGFSSVQGRSGWYYLAGSARQQIPWGGDGYWWNRWEGSRIQQKNQHPSRNAEMVRRWVSGVSGSVVVRVDYRLENWRGNTYIALLKNGQKLWGSAVNSARNQTNTTKPFRINAGDRLELAVYANGPQTNDNTFVRMIVSRQIPHCTPNK